MIRTRLIVPALVAVLAAGAAFADEAGEVAGLGVVYTTPAKKASMYEKPDAKSRSKPLPAETRLNVRAHLEQGGKTTWYRIVPPSGPASAWVKADDVTTKRPANLPEVKPMKLADDVNDVGKAGTVTTAAARGLDGRARAYAASNEDTKKAAVEFVTLEREVLGHFSKPGVFVDTTNATGNVADVPNPVRASMAKEFQEGLK